MRCADARVAPGAVAQFEFLLIAAAVAEGWAVSVPDHEGPQGMWGAPYEPGYHVLDGLRAALNTERLGLSPSAPIGLWGYSGGGLASAWAAEMSGSYAPDLNIVGAVLGSPVGDLGHTFRRLNGTLHVRAARAGRRRAGGHLSGPRQGHPGARHRRGQGDAAAAAQDDDRRSRLRLVKKDMGDWSTSRSSRSCRPPRCSTSSTSIKLGTAVPTPAGTDRAGGARPLIVSVG